MDYRLQFDVTETAYTARLTTEQEVVKTWDVNLVTNNITEIFARLIEELVMVNNTLITEQDHLTLAEFKLFKRWLAIEQPGLPIAGVLNGDGSAMKYLEALRMNGIGGQLERKDGIDFDAQTPLVLTLQYKNDQERAYARTVKYEDLSTYFAEQLLARSVIERSLATWTGFYNQATGRWDRQALAVTGVAPEQLPEIVDTPLLGRIEASFAGEYNLDSAMQIKVMTK
jgi:hypothetical protein